jgi:hypothetical protein
LDTFWEREVKISSNVESDIRPVSACDSIELNGIVYHNTTTIDTVSCKFCLWLRAFVSCFSVIVDTMVLFHAALVVIPRMTERIVCKRSDGLGGYSRTYEDIVFESNSHLTSIEECSCCGCSALRSICIPASADVLYPKRFHMCQSLSLLAFESGSRLTRIEYDAFADCRSLRLLCLPASVQMIDETTLPRIAQITIDKRNQYFTVTGPFLLDFDGIHRFLCLGSHSEITLNREIETIVSGWVSGNSSLSSFSFES